MSEEKKILKDSIDRLTDAKQRTYELALQKKKLDMRSQMEQNIAELSKQKENAISEIQAAFIEAEKEEKEKVEAIAKEYATQAVEKAEKLIAELVAQYEAIEE